MDPERMFAGGPGGVSGGGAAGSAMTSVAQSTADGYVTVYAFRGLGRETDRPWSRDGDDEPYNPLLRNGHVGIQLEPNGPIWGFTPDVPGSENWTKADWDEWQKSLPEGWSMPGSVKDDTAAFEQPKCISAKAHIAAPFEDDYLLGSVYSKSYRVTSQQYALLTNAIEGAKTSGAQTYAFPGETTPRGCMNCGQFVYSAMQSAGIQELPPSSGLMRQYMDAFIHNSGALPWR